MDLHTLINECESGTKFDYLYFWMHFESGLSITKACLSQWYPSKFVVDNISYATAEHWMMASKAKLFNDQKSFEKIINSTDPKEVKSFGRKVENFNETIWEQECVKIVTKGNLEKFKQNSSLKEFLISTNDLILVEASPYDKIWGIGLKEENNLVKNPKNWKGKNLLGFSLMDVRKQLKEKNE
jgi:ribA/ribD-fused uncharacterized protein